MKNWLDENLKMEIKKVFEPRYKRPLTPSEVEDIAENLSVVVEQILKYKWRQKYGNQTV
jgi:hypothetical protein